MVVTHIGTDAGAEEKLRVLDEVLRSETFARSERLKSLLRFLCEAEIEGREAELTEYNIGTMALGRPVDFTPLEDSSVRSRAHELRQRLEKFYAYEMPSAPLRIELRKGSYVPRFTFVQSDDRLEAPGRAGDPEDAGRKPGVEAEAPAPQSVTRRQAGLFALAFAAGAATVIAALAMWSNGSPGLWTPELLALWKPFIGTRTPLLIAFETRFFVQMGPLVVRDWHVNNIGAVETSDPLMRVQSLFGLHQLYPSGNYTDVGAPVAMFYLTRLLSSRVPVMSVKSSPEMTAADLRDNNLILVGKPWMDPEVERVLAGADLVDANGRILNVRPARGEPAEYKDVNDHTDPEGWSEKYSVITMMPNPAGPHTILALTGSGSEHPAALAYYLTNPDTARELYRHLYARQSAAPEYFQVLVKAVFKAKALVKVEYITYRTLKKRVN